MALTQRPRDGRGLDELGPVADDGQDSHGLSLEAPSPGEPASRLRGARTATGSEILARMIQLLPGGSGRGRHRRTRANASADGRSGAIPKLRVDRAGALAPARPRRPRRARGSRSSPASSPTRRARTPLLVFFEGGPGHEAPRPVRTAASPPWLERALQDFRVLMLDQRGTGRSTPARGRCPGAAQRAGRLPGPLPRRLDRRRRRGDPRELGVERWSVLGQSFGGFCALRYLSAAPEGLSEVLFTGGVPALGPPSTRSTGRPSRACATATSASRPLPRGSRRACSSCSSSCARRSPASSRAGTDCTPRGCVSSGSLLGMSDGFERLHYILELDPDSPAFLHDVEQATQLRPQPDLRDPARGLLGQRRRRPAGRRRGCSTSARTGREEFLTGEHIFPWMFEEPTLEPLREAAELLAQQEWPRLYDLERAAAERGPGRRARLLRGPLRRACLLRARPWRDSGPAHVAHQRVRPRRAARDGERVLGRLLDLARGRI